MNKNSSICFITIYTHTYIKYIATDEKPYKKWQPNIQLEENYSSSKGYRNYYMKSFLKIQKKKRNKKISKHDIRNYPCSIQRGNLYKFFLFIFLYIFCASKEAKFSYIHIQYIIHIICKSRYKYFEYYSKVFISVYLLALIFLSRNKQLRITTIFNMLKNRI